MYRSNENQEEVFGKYQELFSGLLLYQNVASDELPGERRALEDELELAHTFREEDNIYVLEKVRPIAAQSHANTLAQIFQAGLKK